MNPFPKPTQPASQQQQLLELLKQNPELLKKYQEELARMQSQAQAPYQPMTSEEYLQKLPSIEKYLDKEGGLVIQPQSAFVLKYVEKRTSEKIFVNVVTHQVIDHPEEKLLVDFENQPGLRIPMSMGQMREDHDKSGNVCKVVDVVLNPKIVQTAETSTDILAFTGQIIGNYLLEKYKIAVAEDVLKKVKGMKYKGSKVEVQRVKGRKAPKIEQLSETEQKLKEAQLQKEQQLFNQLNNETLKPTVLRPEFTILAYIPEQRRYEPYSLEVQQYSHLKIVIDLPHLIHSKGIHLQGSDRMLYLSVKNIYEVCLKLPYEVGKWKAAFARKDRKLVVKVYRKQKQEQASEDKCNQEPKENTGSVKVNISLDNDLLYDLV